MIRATLIIATLIISTLISVCVGVQLPVTEDSKNKTNTCRYRDFQCDDGDCILIFLRCDGYDTCRDSSDEHGCLDYKCSGSDFQCTTSGVCRYHPMVCDGKDDCGDGSDEANCTQDAGICETLSEYTTYFDKPLATCADGHCIPKRLVCDGIDDCGDWSDEIDCLTKQCEDYKFRCPATGECIPYRKVCDGNDDCRDGSDEANCTADAGICEGITANLTDFFTIYLSTCANGSCIRTDSLCDGSPQCEDWSDEFNCTRDRCHRYEFTCGNGACIYELRKCNGIVDCQQEGDGKDEEGCEPVTTPSVDCQQGGDGKDEEGCEPVTTPLVDCQQEGDGKDEEGCEPVTTPSVSVTTTSDLVTTPSVSVTTVLDPVTTPSVSVTTTSDLVTTPSVSVTTLLDPVTTTSVSVTTPSDNITVSSDPVTTPPVSVTTPPDMVHPETSTEKV